MDYYETMVRNKRDTTKGLEVERYDYKVECDNCGNFYHNKMVTCPKCGEKETVE